MHQLAALIVLQNKYKPEIKIYDPVFNVTEIKILEKLNFELLLENEEAKRKLSENLVSLVFFPHCPKQLINNFLWANWNNNLKNCIIISNSFSKILQDCTEKTIKASANYINKIFPKVKEIEIEKRFLIRYNG